MRAILGFLLLLALAAPAFAADTIAFGNRVLSVGDSVARVYQVAGEPSRIVQLENKHGGAVGERFEYFIGDKLVRIVVSGGRVTSITEID